MKSNSRQLFIICKYENKYINIGSMVFPKHVKKLYIFLYKEKIKLAHIKIQRSINLYFVLIQI